MTANSNNGSKANASANANADATAAYVSDPTRYAHIDKLLDNEGPFTADYQGAETAKDFLHNQCKVLVIGAGGLGCEILQNLALSQLTGPDRVTDRQPASVTFTSSTWTRSTFRI